MDQARIPAAFYRGGTSKGLVFKVGDLPDRETWDRVFLAALGSPDPAGRQLDGMGGGISSLSKVCVVGPPSRVDADLDYTFAQVGVHRPTVDFGGNCGNMSAAIGPFAVDEGIVPVSEGENLVRIHNTNTGKIIKSRFKVSHGKAIVDGNYEVPGVTGSGSPVVLQFLDPGGAATGHLLPTGVPSETVQIPGLGAVDISLVDASNPCVFIEAAAVGLNGDESPSQMDGMIDVMQHLEAIRSRAGVMMGISASEQESTRESPSIPFIGLVSSSQPSKTLKGSARDAGDGDIVVRMLSSGKTHKALPLTGAICCAIASRIEGTVVSRHLSSAIQGGASVRLLQPSGVLEIDCDVTKDGSAWVARSASVTRTQRRLFDGHVLVQASRLHNQVSD